MAKKTFNEGVKELAEAIGHAVGKKANKRARIAPVNIAAQEELPQEEDTSIGFG